MSWLYMGMKQNFLETNKLAMFVRCGAHSLIVVGWWANNSRPVAVDFFIIVQLMHTFFWASTNRRMTLKECLGDEKVLKSLSDTRLEAQAAAIEAILMSYPNII